jgi:hypothetical protein
MQAEQDFDRSLSTKKIRQTSEFGGNQSIKINARISVNQSQNLFK